MKNNLFIFFAVFALAGAYYFMSGPKKSDKVEIGSTATPEEAEPTNGEKEVEYDELPADARAELEKDEKSFDIRAVEAEYAIEQAPANVESYTTTETFVDNGEDLMRQALNQ